MASHGTRPERSEVHLQITHKAGIAQQVEQRTRNAKVVGSIPIAGTIKINELEKLFCCNNLECCIFVALQNKTPQQTAIKSWCYPAILFLETPYEAT